MFPPEVRTVSPLLEAIGSPRTNQQDPGNSRENEKPRSILLQYHCDRLRSLRVTKGPVVDENAIIERLYVTQDHYTRIIRLVISRADRHGSYGISTSQ